VSEVDASLFIPDIRPGAAYQGTVSLTCTPAQWRKPDEADAASSSTSAQVIFHACPLRVAITKVTGVSGKKQLKVNRFRHDSSNGLVTVELDDSSVGEYCTMFEVVVAFTSKIAPENIRTGVYCCNVKTTAPSAGKKGAGAAAEGCNALLTHFEVHHAREAFPCPDDPMMRCSRWRVQLQVPSRMVHAVGNTPLSENKDGVGAGGSMRQFVFAKTTGDTSLPAYVVCFAVFADGVMAQHTKPITTKAHAQDIQLTIWAPTASSFPTPFLMKSTCDAIEYLESFFDQPLPIEGGKLDVVVAPSMDLGGMEHHSCIFINESLCGQTSCAATTKAKPSSSTSTSKVEEDIATMITHELTHHWMGNAIGLPFELKEGVCLILEASIGDLVLGRPMRKILPQQDAANAAAAATANSHHCGHAKSKETTTSDEALRGKELTGHTYQAALRKMRAIVADLGWLSFEGAMRRLVAESLGTYVDVEGFTSFLAAAE
jgi:hypothetical protein